MMKMNDIGRKETMSMPVNEVGKGKTKKYYPMITLTAESVPELKGLNVEDKVSLFLNGEIKEITKNDKGIEYRIELKKCGAEKEGKKPTDFEGGMMAAKHKTKKAMETMDEE